MPETPESTDSNALSHAVEGILAGFEAALRSDQRPPLENHLPDDPAIRPLALRELVHRELEHRVKAGEVRLVEEYFQRFPELSDDPLIAAGLIAAEYRLTQRNTPGVTPDSFLERFPEMRGVSAPRSESSAGDRPSIPGYELLDVLGRGGMGVVYKARHRELGRIVALKVVLAGSHASDEERERFRTEARTMATLQHPHIVQIHEVGSQQGQIWLTLEYCAGGTLAEKLQEHPLAVPEAAKLVRTLAEAIQVAHQHQIIHRDLKPANVLLSRSAGVSPATADAGTVAGGTPALREVPKITDFGLAKRLDQQITQSGAVMGTPCYMAPEQAQGKTRLIGPATDVYALGAILYECLTGRPPFRAATALDTMIQVINEEPVPPTRLQPMVPRDLETITLKCLNKDINKRYATAQELADDLGRFLEGRAITARAVGVLERAWRWCRRNPGIASLSAALLVVLLSACVGLTALWWRAEKHRQTAEDERTATKKLLGEFVSTTTTRLKHLDAEQRGPMRRQLDAAQEAAARFGQLPGAQPQDERFLTVVHVMQGDLKERSDPSGALSSYQEALVIARRLHETRPDNVQFLKDLVFVLDRIGRVHLKSLRQLQQAGVAFDEALPLARKVAELAPNDEEAQRLVIICSNDRGDVYFEQSDLIGAEAAFEEGRKVTERLFQRYPQRVTLQHDLSVSHERVANVQGARGDGPATLDRLRRVVELREKVVGAEPNSREWKEDLFSASRKLGQLLHQMGEAKQAIAVYQKGFALHEKEVNIEQADAEDLNHLATWHLDLGTVYLREKDFVAAQTSFNAFVALLQQVVARDKGRDAKFQRNLSVGYNYLGRLHQKLDEIDRAGEYFQKSLPIAQAVAKRHPKDLGYQRDLGIIRILLGDNARGQGKIEESRKHFQAALEQFDLLARQQPEVLEPQRDLAEVCEELSRLALEQLSDSEEAMSWAARGLKALEPFVKSGKVKAFPVAQKQVNDLEGLRQQAGQLRDLLTSLEWTLKQPADQVPGLLTTRALALVRRGEWSEATLTADTLANWKPQTAEAAYDAACVHALAATPEQRPLAVRERHSSRALQLLRQAIRLGYRDVAHLKRDPDLAALRALPEYRAIEKELSALVEKMDK